MCGKGNRRNNSRNTQYLQSSLTPSLNSLQLTLANLYSQHFWLKTSAAPASMASSMQERNFRLAANMNMHTIYGCICPAEAAQIPLPATTALGAAISAITQRMTPPRKGFCG